MHKRLNPIDIMVVTAMSLVLVFSLVTVCSGNWWKEMIKAQFIILSSCAIAISALLAIWMILGGSKSSLWNWMPPFCLFPKVSLVRWLVVFGMIAGTILGIVEEYQIINAVVENH